MNWIAFECWTTSSIIWSFFVFLLFLSIVDSFPFESPICRLWIVCFDTYLFISAFINEWLKIGFAFACDLQLLFAHWTVCVDRAKYLRIHACVWVHIFLSLLMLAIYVITIMNIQNSLIGMFFFLNVLDESRAKDRQKISVLEMNSQWRMSSNWNFQNSLCLSNDNEFPNSTYFLRPSGRVPSSDISINLATDFFFVRFFSLMPRFVVHLPLYLILFYKNLSIMLWYLMFP